MSRSRYFLPSKVSILYWECIRFIRSRIVRVSRVLGRSRLYLIVQFTYVYCSNLFHMKRYLFIESDIIIILSINVFSRSLEYVSRSIRLCVFFFFFGDMYFFHNKILLFPFIRGLNEYPDFLFSYRIVLRNIYWVILLPELDRRNNSNHWRKSKMRCRSRGAVPTLVSLQFIPSRSNILKCYFVAGR